MGSARSLDSLQIIRSTELELRGWRRLERQIREILHRLELKPWGKGVGHEKTGVESQSLKGEKNPHLKGKMKMG